MAPPKGFIFQKDIAANGKLCNSLNSILFIVRIDYPTLSGRCVVEVCCC